MPRTRRYQIAILALATLLLILDLTTVRSQPVDELQPRFGQDLIVVRQAESAGGTSSEVGELVKLLNSALQLNEQALKLTSPGDAQKRAALLAQVDEILASVEAKATQVQAVASQRRFTNTVLAYVSGAVAALVGTIAYTYGLSFYRRYRVKRTFQMRISPK